MRGLGSFLSGVSDGFGTVMRYKRDLDEAKYRDEQRENARKDREEQQRFKDGLKGALAPASVVQTTETRPDTMDNRDVGQPGEAPLAPTGFAVGGQRFTDRASADKFAAEYNSPAKQAARGVSFLRENGKLAEAQQMESGMIQTQAAQQTLARQQKQDALDDNLRNIIGMAGRGDWAGVSKAYNQSYGDGRFVDIRPAENGMVMVRSTDQSGRYLDEGKLMDPKALIREAVASYDPKMWLQQQFEKENREAKAKAEAERNKVLDDRWLLEFDLKKKESAANAGLKSIQAEAARLDLQIKGAETRMPPGVRAQADALRENLKIAQSALAKAQAEGTFVPESAGAQALLRQVGDATTQLQRLLAPYSGPAGAGQANPFGEIKDGKGAPPPPPPPPPPVSKDAPTGQPFVSAANIIQRAQNNAFSRAIANMAGAGVDAAEEWLTRPRPRVINGQIVQPKP